MSRIQDRTADDLAAGSLSRKATRGDARNQPLRTFEEIREILAAQGHKMTRQGVELACRRAEEKLRVRLLALVG